MLNQTAEYALRAVVTIAEQPEGRPIGAGKLAANLGIPQNYLSKTLHQLARAGVLESSRGKFGGFQLARPAARIFLLEIVTQFDDIVGRQTCLMGRTACSDQTPCAAHSRWKTVGEKAAGFFRETTVADLARLKRTG
jgi:Rrf2 family transcriptional regulator, iron-sulfur cluster assembly transcription factor